jgi:uncharacterized protein
MPLLPTPQDPDLTAKVSHLEELLTSMGALVTAYSGGVDSTFLAVAAQRALGAQAWAVTANSASLAPDEKEEAVQLAQRFSLQHVLVDTKELEDENYARNDLKRCFFCKTALMDQLLPFAEARQAKVALGVIVDDAADNRPGETAAAKRGAVFPLRDAGLTKADIRALSALWGLPTADKPAGACLASRIPFGERVTPERLSRVGQAESWLKARGFRACRVRDHHPVARVEVPLEDFPRLLACREEVLQALRQVGYVYITLDLGGLRSGSAHEAV